MTKKVKVDKEIQNRIRLCIFAYAYEFENETLVSDEDYDKLARQINPTVKTGKEALDKFFAEEFDPNTGMWIYQHPDLERIRELYHLYKVAMYMHIC